MDSPKKWKSRPVKSGSAELLLREQEGGNLPFDLPVIALVHKLGKDDIPVKRGYTIELDCFAFGRKIFIRHGHDNTIKIFVQTKSEGLLKVYEGTRGDDHDRNDQVKPKNRSKR